MNPSGNIENADTHSHLLFMKLLQNKLRHKEFVFWLDMGEAGNVMLALNNLCTAPNSTSQNTVFKHTFLLQRALQMTVWYVYMIKKFLPLKPANLTGPMEDQDRSIQNNELCTTINVQS